jgi:hypothetical protein
MNGNYFALLLVFCCKLLDFIFKLSVSLLRWDLLSRTFDFDMLNSMTKKLLYTACHITIKGSITLQTIAAWKWSLGKAKCFLCGVMVPQHSNITQCLTSFQHWLYIIIIIHRLTVMLPLPPLSVCDFNYVITKDLLLQIRNL